MSYIHIPALSSEDDEDISGNFSDNRAEDMSSESELSLSKKIEDVLNLTKHTDCMIDTNTINTKNDCSDANSLIWQKFQFLISVLKDIQDNIQEMDSLILDRQVDMNMNSRNVSASAEENSTMDHLVNAVESSKTDETKLNEILALLHRITRTLSSFEQSPLLAEELKKAEKEVNLHFSTFENVHISEKIKDGSKVTEDKKEEAEYPRHRFAKETSSLRSEIEDAIRRKKVLDERLGLLIAQREQSRLHEESFLAKESKELHRNNQITSEAFQAKEISSNNSDNENKKSLPRKGNKNGETSPSIIDESVLMDLRNDETEIPGLAESGLSSEISSLSITINNILEENKQLHAICNDIAEPVKNEGVRHGAKQKNKLERKSSKQNLDGSFYMTQTSEGDISDGDLRSTMPFAKGAFDRKIKGLIKEQTDMISQLQKEKKKFNEKIQALEKVIAELIKVNRENRMKHVEEFQAIDVENCRLEDEVLSLKRQNQKLLKDLQRFRAMQGPGLREKTIPTDEYDIRSCSCSNHDMCLEYFQLLLKGKGWRDNPGKKCTNAVKGMVSESYPNMSASESNLNDTEISSSYKGIRFSSLPPMVAQKGLSSNRIREDCSSDTDSNKNSEMSVLKARIDSLETYFNQQLNREREGCSRNSGSVPTDDGAVHLDPNTSEDLDANFPHEALAQDKATEAAVTKYKRRVSLLLTEKEEMTNRIEDLMGMMRELSALFRITKEELIATQRERNFMMENLKHNCDGETEQACVDGDTSVSSLSVNRKLQEKCNRLQVELEKARNETATTAIERDRMALEREKMNQLMTTSLADIERENMKLKLSIRELGRVEERKMNSAVDEESQTDGKLSLDLKDENVLLGNISVRKLDEEDQPLHIKKENEKGNQEEINAQWQQSLVWLQRCFVEEKLHSQLLEAAERENAARVAVLQQRVREKGEKYNELLTKYKKLHFLLRSRKTERKANRRFMKECSSRIEEYNSTTVAIENNYKIMLSSLGNNIGIAVEILASHLFLSPSHVHPSPELSVDPAFWFAAQCSRLRWLQAQLRKLCLHSWKSSEIVHPDPFVRRRPNEKLNANDFLKGRSLDLEDRAQVCEGTVHWTSFSMPSSPSKAADKSAKDHPQSMGPGTLSPPVEENNILNSLNDAELSATTQQANLMRTRNSQFSNLVGILHQNDLNDVAPLSGSSSYTSDVPSVRHLEPYCSNGVSPDSSLTETLYTYESVSKDKA